MNGRSKHQKEASMHGPWAWRGMPGPDLTVSPIQLHSTPTGRAHEGLLHYTTLHYSKPTLHIHIVAVMP